MLKYRKGELQFYKSSLPKELRKYVKENPENAKYIEQFLNDYQYNFAKKSWLRRKKDNFLDVFRKGQE